MKLLENYCRMRICIPDDHGERHVVQHNTMDSVTDWQKIMQNGRPGLVSGVFFTDETLDMFVS